MFKCKETAYAVAPRSLSPVRFSTHLLYLFFTRYYLKVKKCVIKFREGRELKGRIKIFTKCIVWKVIFVSCVGGRNSRGKLGKQTWVLLTFKRQEWCGHGLYSYHEQAFQETNRDKLTDGLLLSLTGSMEIYFWFSKCIVFNWYVMCKSWREF